MSEEKKVTVQEKVAIWCLLLIIKIVKPSEYSHEYQNELTQVKELLSK